MYIATSIILVSLISHTIQSVKFSKVVICRGQCIFLYIATPPRGLLDSVGGDFSRSTKLLGHLVLMLKCVSVMI